MNAYLVTYRGSRDGGTAVVVADSEQRAIELVRDHAMTSNFTQVTAELITGNLVAPIVLYNESGGF